MTISSNDYVFIDMDHFLDEGWRFDTHKDKLKYLNIDMENGQLYSIKDWWIEIYKRRRKYHIWRTNIDTNITNKLIIELVRIENE